MQPPLTVAEARKLLENAPDDALLVYQHSDWGESVLLTCTAVRVIAANQSADDKRRGCYYRDDNGPFTLVDLT